MLDGLDSLAPSINFWRHTLIWLGGLAVIVVAVGVMPLLGVGGMQLSKAEAPGPVKDERLAPRITETARSLWLVYALLTLSGVLALRLCGMTWFDAICHAFSAVALGGFSTHDASIGYFHSAAIEFVLIVLMLISALNFARHFAALRRLSLKPYRHDPEVRTAAHSRRGQRRLHRRAADLARGLSDLRHSAAVRGLQRGVAGNHDRVGDGGPTGFTTWPVFAPIWMLFLSGIVCNTGSPGGGIKMFRTLVLARQAGGSSSSSCTRAPWRRCASAAGR